MKTQYGRRKGRARKGVGEMAWEKMDEKGMRGKYGKR